MQFEGNRMYRVKAVAEALDVSVATIYRAIESGTLAALKIGTGKGTLRIPGHAVEAYLGSCGSAAAAQGKAEAEGRACVVCGVDFLRSGNSHLPVGRAESGAEVFACVGRCAERARQAGEVA